MTYFGRAKKPVFVFFAFLLCVMIITLVLLVPLSVGVADAVRAVVFYVMPGILDFGWVTYGYFYIVFFSMWLMVAVVAGIIVARESIKPCRDAKYLCESLKSGDIRAPMVDFEQLVSRVIGGCSDSGCRLRIRDLLAQNIEPIEEFLTGDSTDRKVLLVEGLWGSGKTTNVLVAINNMKEKQPDIRYIYESVFKYSDNIVEFEKDALEALCDVMDEMKLKSGAMLTAMARNLDSDPLKTVASIFRENLMPSNKLLTSDLVYDINKRYDKVKKKQFSVVLILDDLDRLQGDDMVRVLSFLSVVRRLRFVRIIIPVDLDAVVYALKRADVYEPGSFIKKYLPECAMVKVKSDYEIIEQIALRTIRGLQNRRVGSGVDFRAAWAAILMKLFSKKLRDNAVKHGWADLRFFWLAPADVVGVTMPDELDGASRNIMRFAGERVRHCLYEGRRYDWGFDMQNGVQYLEDVVLKTVQRSEGFPVYQHFDVDAYDGLVASWVFEFASECWECSAICLRDVMETVNSCDLSVLSLGREEQFRQVFNQLFDVKLSDKVEEIKSSLAHGKV